MTALRLVTLAFLTASLLVAAPPRAGAIDVADLPAYETPEVAAEAFVAVLMESNQEFLAAFLAKTGLDEETSQIHAQTFFAGLKGATISEVEIVEEKKLGSFLAQFTIALRSSSNAYLFWRLHVLRSSLGHHIYNMSMKDDLTEYFPDWMDP